VVDRPPRRGDLHNDAVPPLTTQKPDPLGGPGFCAFVVAVDGDGDDENAVVNNVNIYGAQCAPMEETMTSVYDINDNAYLGEASPELAEASAEAEPTGAVLARWDSTRNVWEHVLDNEASYYARKGVEVRTVYVAD